MITKLKSTYKRLHAAVERREEHLAELNRQDLLDLSDMTLPDLEREHHAVKIRLREDIVAPEGRETLQERHDRLAEKITLMRRLK